MMIEQTVAARAMDGTTPLNNVNKQPL